MIEETAKRQSGCNRRRRRRQAANSCSISRIDFDSTEEVGGSKLKLDVYVDDGPAQTTRRLSVEIDTEALPATNKFRKQLDKLRQKMDAAGDVINDFASSVKNRKQMLDDFTAKYRAKAERFNAKALKYMDAMGKVGAFTGVMGTIGAISEGNTYESIKGGVLTLVDAGTQVQMKMAVKQTGKTATKFLSSLMPVAGVAMGIWSIVDNSRDLAKAIDDGDKAMIAYYSIQIAFDAINIVLDILELVLGPIATAIQVVFGILSMSVGTFFMSFYEEFKDFKINCTGDIRIMFLKIGKALVKGAVNFLTGGLWSSIEAFNRAKKQHFKFVDQIHELGDFTTFYKVKDSDDDAKYIDFTNGTSSNYGGFISFEMGEPGQAHKLRLDNVLRSDRSGRDFEFETIEGSFYATNVKMMILGPTN